MLQNIDVDYVVYDQETDREHTSYFGRLFPDDAREWGASRTVVRIFGSDEDGAAVTAYVHGFHPYFYAQLEVGEVTIDRSRRGTIENTIYSVLEAKSRERNVEVFSVTLVQRTDIYGYHPDPSWFAKVELYVPSDTPKVRSLIEDDRVLHREETGWIRHTFESNVEYAMRFMVDLDVPGCGWTALPAGNRWTRRPRNLSQCSNRDTLEVDIHCRHLEPRDDTMNNKVAPLVTLCFDIECKGTGGDFPRPRNPGDRVIHIANYVVTGGAQGKVLHWNDFCLGTCAPVRKEGAKTLTFYTEKSLLCTWAEFFRAANPDLVMGYNSIDFDMHYLLERASALGIEEDFSYLGKMARSKSVLRMQRFSSKAYGTRYSLIARLHGRVQFDVLIALRKDTMTKLRSYKLGNVAKGLLKMNKDDMDYKLIPVYHAGSDHDRRKLADYCLQDALLPWLISDNKLYDRSYLELARVCKVPMRFLFLKGQQVKVVAQILRFCREASQAPDRSDQYVMPFNVAARERGGGEGAVSYKGAIVLDPMKGCYEDVVTTLDFSSLYPSIIIAYNLCYTTHLLKQMAERMGLELDLDYEMAPNGEFFLVKERRPGVLPRILENLLAARGAVKQQMKRVPEGSDEYKGLNGRQAGLKVSANSTYGFTGATVGRLPMLEVGSGVTAYGRFLIVFTKAVVEACLLAFHVDPDDYRMRYADDDDDDSAEDGEPALKRRRTDEYADDDDDDESRVPSLTVLCTKTLGLGDDLVTVMPPSQWYPGPGRMKRPAGTPWSEILSRMQSQKREGEGKGRLEVIYGDTDSVMVRIHGVTSIRIGIEVGKGLCRIVNQYFSEAIKLCFEKVWTNFTLLGKKKYFGLHWEREDRPSCINAKGIESVRRDNPLFIHNLMKDVQEALMGWSPRQPEAQVRRPDIEEAIRLVQKTQTLILTNLLPMNAYVTSRTYAKREGDYVGSQEHIEVVKKMVNRNAATAPNLGDRVPYVMIQSHHGAKNFEKSEDPKWAEQNNLPIDRQYYIGRMKKTFLRIFTPILAPHLMWRRPQGRKIPETEQDIEDEKKEEKKHNEKLAHPLVERHVFSGEHTRKIVKPTPRSGGILDYFKPVSSPTCRE